MAVVLVGIGRAYRRYLPRALVNYFANYQRSRSQEARFYIYLHKQKDHMVSSHTLK